MTIPKAAAGPSTSGTTRRTASAAKRAKTGRITALMWNKVCRLADIETALLQGHMHSPSERKRLLRDQHSINCYLTPPRVSRANRWRRRILSIAMEKFPSMHLPPIAEFVSVPEVRAVIGSADAPPHWGKYPIRATISIRRALLERGFIVARGMAGRPRRD